MSVTLSTTTFYRAFLMARNKIDPSEYGVDLPKDEFIDNLCDDFNTRFRGQWTVDELLLHPREALWFCDEVRRSRGYFDVPDDIILRSVMTRRKNPNA
jgi:hypothetical protein